MGKRGFTPRPAHLKALEGYREDRINRDAPVPSGGAVAPPVDLVGEAREIWDRLAPDLIDKAVLTAWDVDAFATGCRAQALLNRALDAAESGELVGRGSREQQVVNPALRAVTSLESTTRSIWSRFGLSPGDRAQLKVDRGNRPAAGGARLLS